MEILTNVKRQYICFKSLVNDFVHSFGRAAPLLLVEVSNHNVPVRERRRIRVNLHIIKKCFTCICFSTAYKILHTVNLTYEMSSPHFKSFQAFIPSAARTAVFWFIAPHRIIILFRRVAGTCCLHLPGARLRLMSLSKSHE